MTFGQQNSEKENFEKIHHESLFGQESSPEEEMSYNNPGRTATESPHIAEHPGEKVFAENRACGMKKKKKNKTALGGEPNEKYPSQILIKKESGEHEYFGSTDEPQESNLITPNNTFFDQEWIVRQLIKMMKPEKHPKVILKKKNLENFCMPEQCMS